MFGNGTRTTHERTAFTLENNRRTGARFSNGMTAHVWAQLTQSFGTSGNGNLFFHGRELYSYGPHFVAGYILPREGGDSHSRGLVLINADSYSNTTSRHVSDAGVAARGAVVEIPELTQLTKAIRWALAHASGAAEPAPCNPGEAPAPINWRTFRRELRQPLADHMASLDGFPGEGMAARVFAALGYDNPERRAARAAAAHAKAEEARKAARAKSKEAESLRLARSYASTSPADVAARIMADARRASRSQHSYVEYARKEAEAEGRKIHRAVKAARAKGWTRIADNAQAAYRALRGALVEYEAAELRHNRRRAWGNRKGLVRRALAALAGEPIPQVGGHYTPRTGAAMDSHYLGEGRRGLAELREALDSWAARPARLAGHDPAELAARLAELDSTLAAPMAEAERREALARRRAELATFRAGFAALDSDGPAAERVKAIGAAERIAWAYAPGFPIGGQPRPPLRTPPGAWAVAGWDPERFNRAESILKTKRAELDSVVMAEARAAEEAKRAELARLQAAAREAWRNRAEPTRDGSGRIVSATTCEAGGAMLRAEGVERDGSGAIVGGRLVTSQQAEAPLAHAIRAFRFLKLCRERGQGWRANGKRLRVGHFTIDSVDSAGNFVAGCHRIQWAEVARLAEALGVAELAPADATESREHV